jgi:hypothetical protein
MKRCAATICLFWSAHNKLVNKTQPHNAPIDLATKMQPMSSLKFVVVFGVWL